MTTTTIQYFRDFFIGRNNAYGIYDDNGNISVVKNEITDKIILRHLRQEITIGSYYAYKIDGVWYCKYICIDFDHHEENNFIEIKNKLNPLSLKIKKALIQRYKIDNHNICREFSGRGYHIWILLRFLTTLERAFDFREDIRVYLFREFNLEDEIFPKQFEISEDGFGNWVKLPLSLNRKNGQFCEILDDFDLTKQGLGYIIPKWIYRKTNMKKIVKQAKKINGNSEKNNIEIKNKPLKWFLPQIKACLRAIAEGKLITHNCEGNYGHLMNIALCNALIYKGASDEIIQKAFSKQPFYNYNKTQKQINSLRRGFKEDYVKITCDPIKERGFCIDCDKENY